MIRGPSSNTTDASRVAAGTSKINVVWNLSPATKRLARGSCGPACFSNSLRAASDGVTVSPDARTKVTRGWDGRNAAWRARFEM